MVETTETLATKEPVYAARLDFVMATPTGAVFENKNPDGDLGARMEISVDLWALLGRQDHFCVAISKRQFTCISQEAFDRIRGK